MKTACTFTKKMAKGEECQSPALLCKAGREIAISTLSSKVSRKAIISLKVFLQEVADIDYSCALSKEILVQGRMYVSEHYICFNSNIFGWVTNVNFHIHL